MTEGQAAGSTGAPSEPRAGGRAFPRTIMGARRVIPGICGSSFCLLNKLFHILLCGRLAASPKPASTPPRTRPSPFFSCL